MDNLPCLQGVIATKKYLGEELPGLLIPLLLANYGPFGGMCGWIAVSFLCMEGSGGFCFP